MHFLYQQKILISDLQGWLGRPSLHAANDWEWTMGYVGAWYGTMLLYSLEDLGVTWHGTRCDFEGL